MLQKYIIYFSLKDSCDVIFSPIYSSFNSAKDGIKNFIDIYAQDRGKKTVVVSKEELKKIKISKIFENCFYMRKKNSEAIVYQVVISEGRIYNSYSIEKLGKIGITEIMFQIKEIEEKQKINETKLYDAHVTNYERGAHVSFVSELKNVLTNRSKKEFVETKTESENNKDQGSFVLSLLEGKKNLKTSKI